MTNREHDLLVQLKLVTKSLEEVLERVDRPSGIDYRRIWHHRIVVARELINRIEPKSVGEEHDTQRSGIRSQD